MATKNDNKGNGISDQINDAVNSKIDINRYLKKENYGKSIADMLRMLFNGQMATETEWQKRSRRLSSAKHKMR
jgi:hypothetical protein